MKFVTSVALALLLAAPLSNAKDKKKKDLPAIFNSARFVYVQAEDGDVMNPGLFPEDRDAIANVQDFLRDWKRYALTINRSEADLVFVVRKGRTAAMQGRGGVGVGTVPDLGGNFPGNRSPAGPGNPNNTGDRGGTYSDIGARTEAGPGEDTLRIYSVTPDGKTGGLLWAREMRDGLDAPNVMLVRALRQEVDRSYPPQPANQPATQPGNQPSTQPTSQPSSQPAPDPHKP